MTPEEARAKLAAAAAFLINSRIVGIEGLEGDRGRLTLRTPRGALLAFDMAIIDPPEALAAVVQAEVRYLMAGFELPMTAGFGSERALPGTAA